MDLNKILKSAGLPKVDTPDQWDYRASGELSIARRKGPGPDDSEELSLLGRDGQLVLRYRSRKSVYTVLATPEMINSILR